YAGNNPLTKRDPTGLYEEDVHYYMTYYLARKNGFQPDQALQIAGATQYVDNSPRTQPVRTGQLDVTSKDYARDAHVLETFHFGTNPINPATPVKRNTEWS